MFPSCRKGSGPFIAAIKAPAFIRARELAIAKPLHHHVFTRSQQDQINGPITVDVQRVGPCYCVQFQPAYLGHKRKGTANLAGIAVKCGWGSATCQHHICLAIAGTIKGRDTAANHILPVARIDAGDARGGPFFSERGDCGRILTPSTAGYAK